MTTAFPIVDNRPTPEDLYQQFHLLGYLISHEFTRDWKLQADLSPDVAQAAFMGLMRSLRYEGHSPRLARTCMRNGARDSVRGETRHRARFPFTEETPVEEALYDLQAVDNRHDITKLLATLPERQRQILELTYLQEMSDQDAASKLHLMLSVVKSEKAEALAVLHKLVTDED